MGDEAPGRQGANTLECLDIPSFCTGSQTGCIGVQNVKLFLSEPVDQYAHSSLCKSSALIVGIRRAGLC